MSRITVLFNADDTLAYGVAADSLAVTGVISCAEQVGQALRTLGHAVTLVVASPDPIKLVRALTETRPEIVFNLVESLGGEARNEAALAALLDLSGYCYTGCGPFALTLALDKAIAKAVLSDRGVAGSRWPKVSCGSPPTSPHRVPRYLGSSSPFVKMPATASREIVSSSR